MRLRCVANGRGSVWFRNLDPEALDPLPSKYAEVRYLDVRLLSSGYYKVSIGLRL